MTPHDAEETCSTPISAGGSALAGRQADDERYCALAAAHSRAALARAEAAMTFPDDLERVRAAAEPLQRLFQR